MWRNNIGIGIRSITSPCQIPPQQRSAGRLLTYPAQTNTPRAHNDAPICPSTASQGAKTLCIYPIWIWDAVNGGFQPQTWHQQHHTCLAIPHFSWNSPPPAHVIWHKGAPMCPSTASQGAKTLCIHPIWMWDAANGGSQPLPWHHNIIQAWPYPFFLKFTPACTCNGTA
jgi:hypothetical protein